jgi:NAD(P)-dependent dehydrogenase (short-subunit alcohol dehydrogenase family)
MKRIVITGSTRGIGYAMADAFLDRGCRLIVNGRRQEGVEQACVDLAMKHGSESLYGYAASVSRIDEVEALWSYAVEHLGGVDIWINNAGLGHDMQSLWEISPEQVRNVIDVNVLGLIYGSQVAVKGMLEQGAGQIYNMEGFGSNGRTRDGLSVYGTSKAAVRYLSKALTKEVEGSGVIIGTLSPGMVLTDLILERYADNPQGLEDAKSVFNIIADTADNVAPWLVEQILNNKKNGAEINYLSTPKMIGRFLKSPFSKRDLFPGDNEESEQLQ